MASRALSQSANTEKFLSTRTQVFFALTESSAFFRPQRFLFPTQYNHSHVYMLSITDQKDGHMTFTPGWTLPSSKLYEVITKYLALARLQE